MNDYYGNVGPRLTGFAFRLGIVLAVFTCSLFFMLFQGGKLAFMLFIIVFILTAYLLMGRWSGVKKTTGTRALLIEQEKHLVAGASVTIRIQVQIPGFWPVPYLFVKDRIYRKNGGEQLFEASLVPDWKRRGEVEYKTAPLRRGVYHFDAVQCSTEDIFGVFEHTGFIHLPSSFRVYPQTVKIKEWNQLNFMFRGTHYHSMTTRAVRETTQINGVREYNYGDRLSRIHWNATAKTGTLKSKEFERESLPKTTIVLDCCKDHYSSTDSFELAVSVAASLLEFAKRSQLSVSLLTNRYIDPAASSSGYNQMHDHLIDVGAEVSLSLQQIVNDHSRMIPAGTFVVVVSPSVGDRMAQTLAWIKQRQWIPCHLWINAELHSSDERWMKHLKSAAILSYSIHSLQELPSVLGGNGR
ncbi:DUF58 domain-containing protein [Paenibacillus sp. J2TS4]|uniref:DUF58 domain-containing protein n=1 Tax=Paenibacillus sp. J2TS4 TaxID=2807194 RepID=UPI001B1602FC|nr:DUF58 domain-containing protein [Paenibacillus sp. J2TS4]GIP35896.1 hypothetical protein J2TS4_51060 [Paenibacillus sp. J2TS4]